MARYQGQFAFDRCVQCCREIDIAVETGTLMGWTTVRLAEVFETVYTIELSTGLYNRPDTVSKLNQFSNVKRILGDSAKWIPQLASEIDKPVFWYLDAHFCYLDEEVASENPYPIWTELEAIRKRDMPDVVAVDDVHAFGRPEGWADVTVENIVEFMGLKHWVVEEDHLFLSSQPLVTKLL